MGFSWAVTIYPILPIVSISVWLLLGVSGSALYIRYQHHYGFRAIFLTGVTMALLWGLGLSVSSAWTGLESESPLVSVNSFSTTVELFTVCTAMAVFGMAHSYIEVRSLDLYILAGLSLVGLLVLNVSNDWLIFYLALELHSLSLYVLATLRRNSAASTEAGLKYFVLGALSSGLFLLGLALVYYGTGALQYEDITMVTRQLKSHELLPMTLGLILILSALLFKVAAVPFHFWAPDVYEGAPTWVTTYFAAVPKLVVTPFLAKIVLLLSHASIVNEILWVSGFGSILLGGIAGLNQTRWKRLLAYSAISHIGFMLLVVPVATATSLHALLIYSITYAIVTLLLFGSLMTLVDPLKRPVQYISQLSGLSRTRPLLAITLSVAALAAAGIPPLIGFYGKWLVFLELLSSQYPVLAIGALLASAISAFYYLRLVHLVFFSESKLMVHKVLLDAALPATRLSLVMAIMLSVLTLWVLLFSVSWVSDGLFFYTALVTLQLTLGHS